MNKKLILAIGLLCLPALSYAAANKFAYEKAVDEAKAAQSAAKAVSFEWRDIGKMLKKADAAAKEGDFKKAIKLAKKAKKQGELGQIQAKEQANAGPPF